MYAYINMYNKLTNRVRALKSTSGLLDFSTCHVQGYRYAFNIPGGAGVTQPIRLERTSEL